MNREITITAVRTGSETGDLRYIALITNSNVREIAPTATGAMQRLFDNHGWRGLPVYYVDSRGEREMVGMAEEYHGLVAMT